MRTPPFLHWDVARHDVEIAPGKAASVPNTKIKEGARLPTAAPEVAVTKARLVDPRGTPMPGVQLIWSSRPMDSDKEGIVLLAAWSPIAHEIALE